MNFGSLAVASDSYIIPDGKIISTPFNAVKKVVPDKITPQKEIVTVDP